MEDIKKNYETYQSMYLNVKEYKQTKALKKELSQMHTYSISKPPLADIPIGCVTRAMMHVILVFTQTFVQFILDFANKVENLALGAISSNTRLGICKILEKVEKYQKWLENQLKGTIMAIKGQEQHTNMYVS